MLPSWFTRLRDVKAGSKHKEQNKLHASSPCSTRRDEDPASFAKSWSLKRANRKAKNVLIEVDIPGACEDSCPSCPCINNGAMPTGDTENVCNSQASELSKDAKALLMHPCESLDAWDHNFISISSSCKRASKLPSSKEIKALTQKGPGVSDNDTEDFALTSETRSSFCSETSSADSSVSFKSGCEERGSQDEQNWQEGNSWMKSSGIVSENLQENCAAGEQYGSRYLEIKSAESMFTCSQNRRQMQQDMRRGGGSFFFSYVTPGRCRSTDSKPESRNSFCESDCGRDCVKAHESCSLVENWASLIIKSAGKNSSKSIEWEKDSIASTKNLPSTKHNQSNTETLHDTCEKSGVAAGANPNLLFDHRDMYIGSSVSLEKSTVDPLVQNAKLEKRNKPHATAESPSGIASSMGRISCESAEESKGRVFSTRRRRQRGASISAVLPPDLQGVVGDSLAFVKMSDNPYEDFRQSIYEMIMEKDLEGSMDVEELLYCYLTLNAPEHHELIEEVFSDVWSAALMTLR